MTPPVIRGGQGRSPRDNKDAAAALVWYAVAIIIALAALAAFRSIRP